jgi:FAD-linked oxidoreductase
MMSTTTAKRALRWRNWSGSVRAAPRELAKPSSLDELSRMIGAYGRAGRHVRVVGSGHSFTPLAQTDDALMTLDGMQGIVAVDEERRTVRVRGGTWLKTLGNDLLARGLAQENLGDIDVQSIAGAISTGTHGTGVGFGTLATQVEGLTLVTASGEVVECSAGQRPDIFKAAQVSLGALGVVAEVTLRVVPAKRLRFQSRRERVDDLLTHLEEYKRDNAHFEFFWLPNTRYAQAKFLNETTAPVTGGNLWGAFNRIVMENGVYWLLSEACRLAPPLTRPVSHISAWGVASVDEVDWSHRVYATPRAVRFQEMEYNVPADHFPAVLAEIRETIARERFQVHFPVECRFVRADDIWLSPAYGRDSAYLAVHMYRGMPYKQYFQAMEAIFRRHDGRPHWGKMHTRAASELAALYPHWEDFRRVRAALDPDGLFLNGYLRRLLAADEPIVAPPETTITEARQSGTTAIEN